MTTTFPQDFTESRSAVRSDTSLLSQAQVIAGSLKVTCTLFVMGMFIIFVGSLAQSRRDVWQVVNQYFRVYVAKVEVRDFFPPSMFPQFIDLDWNATLGIFASFPFPGGWTIGWLLFANLLAAHVTRLRIQASGSRLAMGLVAVAGGLLLMALIVISGNQQTGVETGSTLLSPPQIWNVLLGTMIVTAMALTIVAFMGDTRSRAEKYVLVGIAAVIVGGLVFFMISGPVNLSSMRILWQLLKGCACALVLLVGCQLLFRKRGGIVLLHTGVAILMISELVVGLYGQESLMTIYEKESTTYARDIREVELAIVSPEGGKDRVTAIPEALLLQSEQAYAEDDPAGALIPLEDQGLPFDIRVRTFYRNCLMRSAEPDDRLTESGTGAFAVPVRLDPVDGMNDETDNSAAYVELIDRSSGEHLRTILVSLEASEMRGVSLPERVVLGDRSWDISLRFRRNYRPYTVELVDVKRETYVGSATPKNFQSEIRITDHATNDTDTYTVWMNNPLRYRGETFYQSAYNELPSGKELTTLQVVRNTGWMLPYIGCVVVAFGMFAQFWITLRRFLVRTSGAQTSTADIPDDLRFRLGISTTDGSDAGHHLTRETRPPLSPAALWIPIFTALLCVGWVGSKLRVPRPDDQAMNLYEFGRLPMAAGGRAQPIDSYARNELMLTSHKSTFVGELTQAELDESETHQELLETIRKRWPDVNFDSLDTFSGESDDWIEEIVRLTSSSEEAVEAGIRDKMTAKMPAIRWLLDMAGAPERGVRHRVIRIDNDQILSALGLEQRAGLAYSLREILPKLDSLKHIDTDARDLLRANQDNRLTSLQHRVMDLFNTVRRLDSMQQVFTVEPSDGLLPMLARQWEMFRALNGAPAPMAIATALDSEQRAWETVRAATLLGSLRQGLQERGLKTRADLEGWYANDLPRETLLDSVETNVRLLTQYAEEQAGDEPVDENAVKELAARMIPVSEDRLMRDVMSLIAAADPGATPQQIVDGLGEERIAALAGEKVTRDLIDVFSALQNSPVEKERLDDIRERIRSSGEQEAAALGGAVNQELFKVVLDDLEDRAGPLLYPANDAEAFEASVTGVAGALAAWRTGDVIAFNQSVENYGVYLAQNELPHLSMSDVNLETRFNLFDPFGRAMYLYLPAILLSFLSWIVWPQILRRMAFAMIVVGLIVHTLALWARLEISGRPPVTSLYSSAIFIGWAIVLASLVIERLVGYGIGNIVAASVGTGTLLIAHYLHRDEGDTFSVMQAVLDTTFWLATHVVCITLGYGATFLAGALGLCYVVQSHLARRQNSDSVPERDLAFLGKIVYGILCFAVFFSLVGTVLGGLWADDSWGRFWGWDPKENGALIIVLWNALILHARWDKMVRDYGTAVLAMAGNIVTAWSWFGVNELKAGLHTYGFTEGRLLMLAVFVGVQAAIIVLAAVVRPPKTAAT